MENWQILTGIIVIVILVFVFLLWAALRNREESDKYCELWEQELARNKANADKKYTDTDMKEFASYCRLGLLKRNAEIMNMDQCLKAWNEKNETLRLILQRISPHTIKHVNRGEGK